MFIFKWDKHISAATGFSGGKNPPLKAKFFVVNNLECVENKVQK